MAEKPAFYNNWKGGAVPTGSTVSGANQDLLMVDSNKVAQIKLKEL